MAADCPRHPDGHRCIILRRHATHGFNDGQEGSEWVWWEDPLPAAAPKRMKRKPTDEQTNAAIASVQGHPVAPLRPERERTALDADKEREEGREVVAMPVPPEVRERYLTAIRRCAEAHAEFIVDQVWEVLEGDRWPEKRFMGNMLMVAAHSGWIEARGYAKSNSAWRTNHPVRVWGSLINSGGS